MAGERCELSSQRNTKPGTISSGDATVKPQGTITNMESAESKSLLGGVEALRNSCPMWDRLLHDNIHLSDWIIQKAMSRVTLNGQPSKNKMLIVGTPFSLISEKKRYISQNSVDSFQFPTNQQENDWLPAGE